MKKNKIIYWTTTIIIGMMMLFSSYQYLTSQQMKDAFIHLGFPSYFRVELALFKLIGAIVLLFPQFVLRYKEWAYSGFGIVFISASIAHYCSGDAFSSVIIPIVFLIMLVVSYLFMRNVLASNSSINI